MYEMWIIIYINRIHTVDIYDFMHHIYGETCNILSIHFWYTHGQAITEYDIYCWYVHCTYERIVSVYHRIYTFYLCVHRNGEFKSRQIAIK